ncbi:hypothetical protein [Hymenobacter sp. BRD67]|uniref:hypothetical protein n=1 Tax=Hymenobacter sp. BRD67 TaxID=2675877 RepID=UPI0015642384|nr:hypothetical protein [Hymenobacter sp. BRD67]QKG53668.1 hypothetical protein GKZ67_14985 [Hymenobacter sp. BRD67]
MIARRAILVGAAWWLWLAWWLLSSLALQAQPAARPPGEAVLLPVPAAISLAGPLKLAFRLRGTPLVSHSEFPEIEGFRKGGQATTTATQLLPGGATAPSLPWSSATCPIPKATMWCRLFP